MAQKKNPSYLVSLVGGALTGILIGVQHHVTVGSVVLTGLLVGVGIGLLRSKLFER
jgi:hypothetical protein